MTMAELLSRLETSLPIGAATRLTEVNGSLLRELLDSGARVEHARYISEDAGPDIGPSVLLRLRDAAERSVTLVLGLGEAVRALLVSRLPEVPVHDIGRLSGEGTTDRCEDDSMALAAGLAEQFRRTRSRPARERAAELMDWVMERIDATRCALVPVVGGTHGPPLSFHLRGSPRRQLDPRRVPRAVLRHVTASRQPVVSHEGAGEGALAPIGTIAEQGVRAYMAVPVIFHGDLLAIAWVDRLDQARPFTLAQQAVFQALAYELARPVLEMREDERRAEFDELRDARLSGPGADSEPTSPGLRSVLDKARRLATRSDHNLLVLGETGVGKEWLARRIHAWSRWRGPFAAVNVAALPESLFESELMGTVRGAFTGAQATPGRIAGASGGTLFLDEIGDLDLRSQVKLLRFLQSRSVTPVGGATERPVDVRVVAATNRPLARLVREGAFREDLLHRFAPPLVVPPLRERRDEILPLAERVLTACARRAGVRLPALTDRARHLLATHRWPGNVRQVEMVLAHALVLCSDDEIDDTLLSSLLGDEETGAVEAPPDELTTWADLQSAQAVLEARFLRKVLADHGTVESAARAAGCPSSTFRRALQLHGLK